MPLHTPFDEINLATFQRLVDDEVPEDRQLEYKRELNISSRENKREFLADVSAFANADGGHLIYGIAEREGIPAEACGIQRTASDDEMQQQMQNLVRDGVEPNIHGINIKAVEVNEDKVALIIHIPTSWSKPHWVSLGRHRTFYSRNSNGKYPLDIPELRQLFTLSETATERIRNFRAERIAAILEGSTPVPLNPGPKFVMHLVPFSSSSSTLSIDLSVLRNSGPHIFENNFEGKFTARQIWRLPFYHQVFRDGSVESVFPISVGEPQPGYVMRQVGKIVYGSELEVMLWQGTLGYVLSWHDALGVVPPLFIMLSLLDIRDHKFCLTLHEFMSNGRPGVLSESKNPEGKPIRNQHLLLSEVVMESSVEDAADLMSLLQPTLNHMWQSSGLDRSPNFDGNSEWRKPNSINFHGL